MRIILSILLLLPCGLLPAQTNDETAAMLQWYLTMPEHKFELDPFYRMISYNDVDGFRTRIGGQTTANLHDRLFLKGYYARGFKSGNDYYNAELTYSLNEKKYLSTEFPVRSITFASTNDIRFPGGRFAPHDKDNALASLKWTSAENMMYYNRQQLRLVREDECNLRTSLVLTAEKNTACGKMSFVRFEDDAGGMSQSQPLRTTEARLELRYAPGESFLDTRKGRVILNGNAPVLTFSHSVGISGVLGGQYNYHHTEFTAFKRASLKEWGHIDFHFAAGAQWSRVPFPLLCIPKTNLSYLLRSETFCLVNNMEFFNDRYAGMSVEWNLGGKLLNLMPLMNELKWQEYVGVKTLWGDLTDKNNPYLAENASSDILMPFPIGSYLMDSGKPYVEMCVGIRNIFRFFGVEYVRRLNYLDLPTAHKHGVRLEISLLL